MNEKSDDINKKNFFIQKLKELPLVQKVSSSKSIKIILAIIIFVIGLLIIYNMNIGSTKSKSTSASTSNLSTSYTSSKEYVEDLENKLTKILSAIKGAGDTKVMITIENGPEIKIANNVEEKTVTTSSGSTVTVVSNPILIDYNGEQVPLVTMEIVPKIKGVIVVSSGASDVRVRLDMLYAIQALMEVSNDKIQIFSGS